MSLERKEKKRSFRTRLHEGDHGVKEREVPRRQENFPRDNDLKLSMSVNGDV